MDLVSEVSLSDTITSQLSGVGAYLVSLPIRISSSFLEILLVIFISFYWLITVPSMHRFIQSLFPPGERGRVKTLLSKMGSAMGGYVRGSA